ncbi:Glycosyl transferase family 2 [Nakamurella panacisegetis]|uniref:4,4'-diaponeurosporenoate glycosyltransferase n=1 Tax=Nakamurella panacisegetis TaxID=1090615 RepID=A0A1H0SUW4_9ACTN|nr:glycosyltransferase [Nakamurella panacisegetis]SDP45076.1 Glycosyl transferase family 2 [Nakamurella panacisegetis]
MSPFDRADSVGGGTITEMLVVIPARNEELHLPRALAALEVARNRLSAQSARPPMVRVLVVLDRCTDRSAEVVAQWDAVQALTADDGSVGAARGRGIAHGLATSGRDPREIWIACTDADSAVPADWLLTHLRQAQAGADLLLGTVRPDPQDVNEKMVARWISQHRLADGHPHIHGANLGIRADCYLRAGGFLPISAHEDRLLVEAVRRLGARVVATGAGPVLTSGRLVGRAPEGFAQHLRELTRRRAPLVPRVELSESGRGARSG